MYNEEYIKYLNTLHNVGAKNENAIAEASQSSPFYQDIMVKRPIVNIVAKWLTEHSPHIILITGHAGDGKTSLLIQVLDELNALQGKLKPWDEVVLSNGKECLYIKDFSEFSAVDRKGMLKRCLQESKNGKHVILVANTGPLLNTFLEEMGSEAQMKLINAIDINTDSVININEYGIRAINIASIDNSSFVRPFLKNLISNKCFDRCTGCTKKNVCPILFNRNIVLENQNKVFDFLHHHFIWQQEHGKRLTIRQIIAQITFSLTSGLECKDVKNVESMKYLFDHLFCNSLFGYKGIKLNKQALAIQAIADMHQNGYDNRSLVSDEEIFILQDYSILHPKIQEIVAELKNQYWTSNSIEWRQAIRRMYIMFNIQTDVEKNLEVLKCVFSKKFHRYLELRNGKTPNNDDKSLIMEAFSILHTGYASKNIREVPITLKRSNSIDQSVQLLYGTIPNRDIKLKTVNTSSCNFGEEEKKQLYIEVLGTTINQPILLPLLNYFEDIRSGAISTNIDPQLTHGIDSIKAQMLSLCKPDSQSDIIEMLVMGTQGWGNISLQEESSNYILINY
ncbi:MAG: hypothetical protein APF77_07875 [Clostridia bacterium BRH_c25]|nr:MAG: hypothetical protein APF77_07875 [Clostridia bacterium BRH_c25]